MLLMLYYKQFVPMELNIYFAVDMAMPHFLPIAASRNVRCLTSLLISDLSDYRLRININYQLNISVARFLIKFDERIQNCAAQNFA